MDILTKLLGYYTLYFIILRLYRGLNRVLKKTDKDKKIEVIAVIFVYMPMITFIVIQLVK